MARMVMNQIETGICSLFAILLDTLNSLEVSRRIGKRSMFDRTLEQNPHGFDSFYLECPDCHKTQFDRHHSRVFSSYDKDDTGYNSFYCRLCGYKYGEHEQGWCFVEPEKRLCYLNIPRIASTSLRRSFMHIGFTPTNYFSDLALYENYNTFTVVRHPIDRSLSAFNEIRKMYPYKLEYLNTLVDDVYRGRLVDVHVEK